MDRYVAQKADQALEALCSGESLQERLKTAKLHFIAASPDHWEASSTPAEVANAITQFLEVDVEKDLLESSKLVRRAIATVFEQYGRENPEG